MLVGRAVGGETTKISFPEGVPARCLTLNSMRTVVEADCPQMPDLHSGDGTAWRGFGEGFMEWLGGVCCNVSNIAQYAQPDDEDMDER